MADLLVKNVPDDVVRTYEACAKAAGEALETYVGDVLAGRRPVVGRTVLTRSALIERTRQNLARFERPLVPMSRHLLREGFEE